MGYRQTLEIYTTNLTTGFDPRHAHDLLFFTLSSFIALYMPNQPSTVALGPDNVFLPVEVNDV